MTLDSVIHGNPMHCSLNYSSMRNKRWRAIRPGLLSCCFALSLMPLPASAQASRPSEYQVKSVYLYNFGKFVTWPRAAALAGSAFVICVLGDDPMMAALNVTLAGESVNGKTVVLRRIPRAQDSEGCNIVYVSASEERRLQSILEYLGQRGALTVSDLQNFAERGGMIQFVMDDGRIRFEVNRAAAARAGLMLSADLLKVAIRVRE